jgi:putative hydrolase of the HAD superfamily
MSHKWVIFDGDNTLWNTEVLYDNAREKFCKYLLAMITESNETKGNYITLEMIDKSQRHRDLQLYKTHGYSCTRFARSFEDTMSFFLPNIKAKHLSYVRSLAMSVFYSKAHSELRVDETLKKLAVNNYNLAIISAGEEWVQRRRLNDFHLIEQFRAHAVVEKKTQKEFSQFCNDHGVDILSSWMVGDSPKSDIGPARAVGLKAIHIQSSNWLAEHDNIPEGVPSVATLAEILQFILVNAASAGTESAADFPC